MGLDCASRGGQELLALIEDTPLFRERVAVSLEKCVGCCRAGAEAPVAEIGGIMYTGLSAESLADLLNELIGKES